MRPTERHGEQARARVDGTRRMAIHDAHISGVAGEPDVRAPARTPVMERPVPLWALLLVVLMGVIATVLSAWLVRTTLENSVEAGPLGKAAVVASVFPSTAIDVLSELREQATGEASDASGRVARPAHADYQGFRPVSSAPGVPDIPGLLVRGAPQADGWRVLVGTFGIGGKMENAALLLSSDLEVARAWILDETAVDGRTPRPTGRKFVHGLEVLPDGSLVFTFHGAVSLQRFDSCGARQWATGGDFHHAVTLDEAGETVWTFSDQRTIAEVAVADGAIVRTIPIGDVIAANPDIDILEIRRFHPNDTERNARDTDGAWLADPFHFNDVEPLPAAWAAGMDGFAPGDLLLSARSLNLVFVLDPETLQVKWWRVGATQRQHDPDWLPPDGEGNGAVMVLNNRMSRDYSEVVALGLADHERTVLHDGRDSGFYTRIRGKHQRLPDGSIAIASSQQGRAFEVAPGGEVALDFANLKPGSDTTNYTISELRWLPTDYFDMETWTCPLPG